jgi:hypothetical protein
MIGINGATTQFQLNDGSKFAVDIVPESFPLGDKGIQILSVYKIFKTKPLEDLLSEDEEVNHDSNISGPSDMENPDYLGTIAFKEDDLYEWEYLDDKLTDEQLEKVIIFIQNHESPEFIDESFYVKAFYLGTIESFQILPNEGHFGVVLNGKLIAEIQNNEIWEQTSGKQLDENVFSAIVERIENYYE